jgi:hypothetical protein
MSSFPPHPPASAPASVAVASRPVTVREGLGSPSALRTADSVPHLLVVSAVVVLQESVTGVHGVGLVLVALVLQQSVRTVLLRATAAVLQRRGALLPLWAGFAFWSVLGMIRGTVGGLVAVHAAGVAGDFGFRIVFWGSLGLVWECLFLHTAAQLRNRRALLSRLAAEVALRDEARRQAQRSSSEIREHLIEAVRGSIGPAVEEITRSLRVVSPTVDRERIRLIGERLGAVSSESSRMVQRLSAAPDPGPPQHTGGAAPLVTVLDFEYRRPVLSVALGALALLALIVPLTNELERDPVFLLQLVVSVGVSALGMVVAFGVQDRERRAMTGLGAALLRYLIAGLLASTALLLFQVEGLGPFVDSLLLVLPVGAVVSSVTVAAAVGLPESNRDLLRVMTEVEAERRSLAEAALEEENQVRLQLSELMHGPIQGRLAACAMALNFHSAEIDSAPDGRTDFITATVLSHLEAASDDLVGLSRVAER